MPYSLSTAQRVNIATKKKKFVKDIHKLADSSRNRSNPRQPDKLEKIQKSSLLGATSMPTLSYKTLK